MRTDRKSFRSIPQYAIGLLFLIVYSFPSFAQNSIGVPPLVVDHPQPSLGFEFGVGQNTQLGTMTCECGSSFTGGKGTGWSGSAFYELPVAQDFFAGIKVGFVRENTSVTASSNDEVVVVEPNRNQLDTAAVQDNRVESVTLSFLRFAPYIQYQILHSGFFVQVGAGISVLLSSTFIQTRQLPSNSAVTLNGQTYSNLTFANGTTSETIQSGSFGAIANPQFSGLLSAGYNVRFGTVSVAPIVNYDFPFSTNNSANGNNWKISTISGSIAMKFNL
jgi:hypothetical protein